MGRRAYLGQSSVEYAVVLFAFMAVVVALGAAWRLLAEGAVVNHALMNASHHVQEVSPGAMGDVFLY